jgi:hypothetical protein
MNRTDSNIIAHVKVTDDLPRPQHIEFHKDSQQKTRILRVPMKGFISMKFMRYIWIMIFIAGMGSTLQAGEIYQWIDEDGVQHFTDGPPPPGAQIVESLSETPSDEPPAGTGKADDGDTGKVERDESRPADSDDTGAIEGVGNRAPDDEANTVEGNGNTPTDREDYWRRLGWGEDQTGPEDNGPVEGGENRPVDGEATGPTDDGASDAVDDSETGAIEGGDKRFRQW